MYYQMAHQKQMFLNAASRITRLYIAAEEMKNEGMTRAEFRKMIDRRPEHYAPIAYLADCDAFWVTNGNAQ